MSETFIINFISARSKVKVYNFKVFRFQRYDWGFELIFLFWTLDHPCLFHILCISGQWSLYKTSVKGVCRIWSGLGSISFFTFSIGGWILPRIHIFAFFFGGGRGCSATAPVPCVRPWILCPRGQDYPGYDKIHFTIKTKYKTLINLLSNIFFFWHSMLDLTRIYEMSIHV